MITIKCGPNEESADLVGYTVAQVREMYETEFNIPSDAIPLINGSQNDQGEKYTLKDGDTLEFSTKNNKGLSTFHALGAW